jgi:hypothetical protein
MHNKRSFTFLVIAITLLVGGAILWILNIMNVIEGPWSSILGVIFTILGIVLGLLQWHVQLLSDASPSNTHSPNQRKRYFQLEGFNLGVDKQKGALVIYADKNLRGATINLHCGFDRLNLHADSATNIVERKMDGRPVFVGVFPSLEPRNYTVYLNSQKRIAQTTIYSNHVSEIDWR